jgi:heterodisulfide reductase subunit C
VTLQVDASLLDEVRRHGAFEASACMNCGACTASCPLGLDVLPRQLFRQVLLGLEERLLAERETVYSCLLCGLCEVNCCCAGETHITENVRTLRGYLNRKAFGL